MWHLSLEATEGNIPLYMLGDSYNSEDARKIERGSCTLSSMKAVWAGLKALMLPGCGWKETQRTSNVSPPQKLDAGHGST